MIFAYGIDTCIYLYAESLAKLGNHLKEKQGSHILDFTNFIQAVTEGNIETVKTIIEKHPGAVNNISYISSIYIL